MLTAVFGRLTRNLSRIGSDAGSDIPESTMGMLALVWIGTARAGSYPSVIITLIEA